MGISVHVEGNLNTHARELSAVSIVDQTRIIVCDSDVKVV